MALEKKTMFAIIVDLVCIFITALPCVILYLAGEPYMRGFFCNDESIRHPYKSSTIPTAVLVLVCGFLPIVIFIAVELALVRSSENKRASALGMTLYNTVVVFIFGMAVNQLITDICKYSVGRLRPHFLDACNPELDYNEETCGTEYEPKYVTDFNCSGSQKFHTEEEREEWANDARLSFISGHASMSAYSMLFAIIYLQNRLTNRNYRLVKPLIQSGCVLFCVYTSLSRISDYKHHPMDVLGGLVLGFFLATITHTLAKDVFRTTNVTTATSTTTLLTGLAGASSYTLDDVGRAGSP